VCVCVFVCDARFTLTLHTHAFLSQVVSACAFLMRDLLSFVERRDVFSMLHDALKLLHLNVPGGSLVQQAPSVDERACYRLDLIGACVVCVCVCVSTVCVCVHCVCVWGGGEGGDGRERDRGKLILLCLCTGSSLLCVFVFHFLAFRCCELVFAAVVAAVLQQS
jgi:hypothetical protein